MSITIEITDDASETFQDLMVNGALKGYRVGVTTVEGETFDAEVVGADTDAGWYDALKLRRYADFESRPNESIETARVERMRVY